MSGGKEISVPQEAMREIENPGFAISDLWMWFLLAAALLLPLDIAVRRIALPINEMVAAISGFFKRSPEKESTEARMERLRSAKKQATKEKEEGDEAPTETIVIKKTPNVQEEQPSGESSSAASRLLERKRKRQGSSDGSRGTVNWRLLMSSTITNSNSLPNLWDSQKVSQMNDLDQLVYVSNLLGSDPRITNFGGGNTSVKAIEKDPLTGEEVEVMWVKGSGGDLGTAKADGFASLYLDKVIALKDWLKKRVCMRMRL